MEIVEKISTVRGDVCIFCVTDSDIDSPVAANHLTKVLGEGWEIHRWWFFEEFELERAKRFAVRLLYDKEFRNMSRQGETAWKQVHDLYRQLEGRVIKQFTSRDLLEFSPSELNPRTNWAWKELWSLLREIYTAISGIIDDFGLPAKRLDPYLSKQIDSASSTATMISESGDNPIKNIRPRHRWLEYRGDGTAQWIIEDVDHTEFANIVDLYSGEYGPVAAIISPYLIKDLIKDLDWDKTHRSWNDERECWEVDFDSVEYIIKMFQQERFTLRICDPVAQILDINKPPRPSALHPERMLPTMQSDSATSATDFLIIPGLTPDQARKLIQEGFLELSDLAYSSIATITETKGISTNMAHVLKEGALSAIGERKPAAVKITAGTPLSLPEAQREIEGLASSGVPPSEVADVFECMCGSNLFEFDSISNRDLYYLHDAGFCSAEEILAVSMAKLAGTKLISQNQAEAIRAEAKNYVRK